MKSLKKILAAALLLASTSAGAYWQVAPNGIVYSNFCRAGMYWYIFPTMQPIGTSCWIDTPTGRWFGNFVME